MSPSREDQRRADAAEYDAICDYFTAPRLTPEELADIERIEQAEADLTAAVRRRAAQDFLAIISWMATRP